METDPTTSFLPLELPGPKWGVRKDGAVTSRRALPCDAYCCRFKTLHTGRVRSPTYLASAKVVTCEMLRGFAERGLPPKAVATIFRRIVVVGPPGAGKSTLARSLAAISGLPLHHLDQIFHRPGWTPTPRQEWIQIQEQLVREECWILDGNYGATLELRLVA